MGRQVLAPPATQRRPNGKLILRRIRAAAQLQLIRLAFQFSSVYAIWSGQAGRQAGDVGGPRITSCTRNLRSVVAEKFWTVILPVV